MRLSLFQMTSTDRPSENLAVVLRAMEQAQDSDLFLTPEVTNCVSLSRGHQDTVLEPGARNTFITVVQNQAKALNLWTLLGSVAIKTTDSDGRFANRSVLISDVGRIVQWYDKLHMFDVSLSDRETYRESNGYQPGGRAVCVETDYATLGLTICYDVRFPYVFRDLAQTGAQIITVPSAFAVPTGQAHWEILLRARAIETGCFIVAPAQTGTHPGSGRKTFGHSMVVAPWGDIILDAGTEPGIWTVDIDLAQVDTARGRVPSFSCDRPYQMTTERLD
ncbi:MAG: carbon-nitrogen hydrolase family protein [Pseudomonadota bacterium]